MSVYDPLLTKQALQRGYWIVTHRLILERWTTVILYAVILVSYLIFFINFASYLYRYDEWEQLVEQSTVRHFDWRAIHAHIAPLPLEFGAPLIFARSDGVYDIVVEVFNPNDSWAVESLSYSFTSEDPALDSARNAFVLPRERRYLTALGFKSDHFIREVDIRHTDYAWRKMSRLPEFGWIFDGAPAFMPRQVVINQGQQRIVPTRVRWTVTNGSTLHIRSVLWQAVLYSGMNVVAVLEYRRDKKFPFLDKQDFEIFLYDDLPHVDRVEVKPIVNIFDPDFTYIPDA